MDAETKHELFPTLSLEGFVASCDVAKQAFDRVFAEYRIAQAALAAFGIEPPELFYLKEGGHYTALRHDTTTEELRSSLERKCWAELFRATHVERVMSRDARAKLHESIHASGRQTFNGREVETLPPLTVENIETTFAALYERRGDFFNDAVEAVFRALSWDYKTHNPLRFTKRMIIDNALSYVDRDKRFQGETASFSHDSHIADLERVLWQLDGCGVPLHNEGVAALGKIPWGEWVEVHGPKRPLFKVRLYRKGTGHIEILDSEHVHEMNRIMSARYPNAIASEERPMKQPKPKADMKPKTVTVEPRVLDVLRRSTFTDTTVQLPDEQLPRDLYEEVNKVIVAAGGKWNRSKRAHVFPEGRDPRSLLGQAETGAVVNIKQTTQAFYTPKAVAERAVELLDMSGRGVVLEPSAGHGALIDAVLEATHAHVMAFELDAASFDVLGRKYKSNSRVTLGQGDFLSVGEGYECSDDPKPTAVVMNPPFTRGQAQAHVRHALYFLAEDEVLVAILPANAEHDAKFLAELEKLTKEIEWEPIEEGAFTESGTKVSTVFLRCVKSA